MYPSLDNESNILGTTQLSYRKTLSPSQAMMNAVVQLRQVIPSITSFRPHLNTHECHLNMILNNKMSIPMKIVFLRNYPKQRPLIFINKWMQHPFINPLNSEVAYQQRIPWTPSSSLNDLMRSIQSQFTKQLPTQTNDITRAMNILDQYQKSVESLRMKPQGTQPPQPPQLNLENILKVFQYQQNLYSRCQQKNSLYLITAQEYSENVSRAKCIGERFSKGKILRELENQIEQQIVQESSGRIEDQLAKYYQSRKKYHQIKILKDRYLEDS